jgi:ribonuclease HII
LEGLDDSKRLTARQREKLAAQIKEIATASAMASVEAPEIDQIGMAAALRVAVRSALDQLDLVFDQVLIDGLPLGVDPHELAIVGGDGLEAAIAAASILAKVTRDAWMIEADTAYPEYHLAANKGYASRQHIAALREFGPSEIHRKSFLFNILSTQETLF